MNVAPVVTISYGSCEIDFAIGFWRAIAQQANAQGITILNSVSYTHLDVYKRQACRRA